mmetsp:Transcript_20890/g.46685  ORF Transcript_20890/g.46685 Transcript_20890/m.46685 type:complete len:275 (-) Transcript_20890:522-1346(-)
MVGKKAGQQPGAVMLSRNGSTQAGARGPFWVVTAGRRYSRTAVLVALHQGMGVPQGRRPTWLVRQYLSATAGQRPPTRQVMVGKKAGRQPLGQQVAAEHGVGPRVSRPASLYLQRALGSCRALRVVRQPAWLCRRRSQSLRAPREVVFGRGLLCPAGGPRQSSQPTDLTQSSKTTDLPPSSQPTDLPRKSRLWSCHPLTFLRLMHTCLVLPQTPGSQPTDRPQRRPRKSRPWSWHQLPLLCLGLPQTPGTQPTDLPQRRPRKNRLGSCHQFTLL